MLTKKSYSYCTLQYTYTYIQEKLKSYREKFTLTLTFYILHFTRANNIIRQSRETWSGLIDEQVNRTSERNVRYRVLNGRNISAWRVDGD